MKGAKFIIWLLICSVLLYGTVYANNISDTYVEETTEVSNIQDNIFVGQASKEYENRIGDSYYGWSLSLPEDAVITDRSFNGLNTTIEGKDGMYKLTLNILEKTDEALYALTFGMNMENPDVLGKGVGYNSYNYGYNWIVSGDDNNRVVKRWYVGEKWIFYLQLDVNSRKNYRANIRKYLGILNSFIPEFSQETAINDLSTVNENGYRTFFNEAMGWKIDVLPEWEMLWEVDKPQKVIFKDIYSGHSDNELMITMSSKGDIANLDSWVSNDVIMTSREYNADMVQLIRTEKQAINGMECSVLIKSINTGEQLFYEKIYYLLEEHFKYRIRYTLSEDAYYDDEFRSKVEAMVQSFCILSPDIYEIGYLTDPDEFYVDELYKTIKNEEAGWSLEVPYSWEVSVDLESHKTFISEQSGVIHVGMGVAENVYLEQFENYYENLAIPLAQLGGNFKNEKIETLKQKGTIVKKYTNSIKKYNDIYREEQYVFYKDGYLYTFSVLINQLRITPKNIEVIDRIWKSVAIIRDG